MLREIKDGALVRDRLTPFGWRWGVRAGGAVDGPTWSTRRVRAIAAAQREEPVALADDGRRRIWLFEDRFYWSDDELAARDVLALVRERERRARRRLERAHASLAQEGLRSPGFAPRRERIPTAVRQAVFERDGGCCVECGSHFDLQYDHVIPFSRGGASAPENLQLLCADCNRRKGDGL
jgi:hypothetical protein